VGDLSVGGGVLFAACQGFAFTNNIIADNEASYGGTEIYLQHMSGVPNRGYFLHNTIARDQGIANLEGIRVTGTGTVVTFTNTIIAGHNTGINVSFGTTATLVATLWDNATNWGDVGAIFTGTVNLWGNPDFLNPGGGDYHIAGSSLATNQGVDAGILTDIDGDLRDLYPDLGADEAGAQSLQAVKEASATTLYPGDLLTYTLTIRSASALSVTSVVLTDTFPGLQRPLGVAFDLGDCDIPDAGFGGRVTCTLGDLEGGQSAHVTITAQATSVLPPNPPHEMRNNLLVVSDQAQTTAYADTVLKETPNCLARLNGTLPEYVTVQAAVDAASPGDEVWISGECLGAEARNGTTQQVYLAKNLTLRGGYKPDFSTWDPVLYPTTLDAELEGRVIFAAEAVSVALEYLNLTGGDATGLGGSPDGFGNAGGGLYALGAAVRLSGCQVTSNVASRSSFDSGFGGGVAVYSGTLTIEDSTLDDNAGTSGDWALGLGGGLYAENSTVRLDRTRLEENDAAALLAGLGGGAYLYESDLEANASLWLSNAASAALDWGQGGGLFVMGTRPFTLTNCVLVGNRATDATGESGGGLWVEGSPGVLRHATLASNQSDEGIHVTVSTTLTVINSIIADHVVGLRAMEGSMITMNGILWHDNISNTVAVTATIQVSNALTGDPAFEADGYHLTASSAAIDAGVNAGVTTDLDGEPRPDGTGYDLGADELGDGYAIYLPLISK